MLETFTVEGLPDGATLDVPYFDVRGERSGPHITVVAGVHGTEYSSIAAVREFAETLDPAGLAGRVTAVPVMNLPTFWARSPFVVPVDGKNLNRCFPGDLDGTYTDVLAHRLFHRFIAPADYFLDLHGGDLPEAIAPFALYDESPVEEAARGLAVAFGVDHIVRQALSEQTVGGSSQGAAAAFGVPAIIAEAGGNGLLERSAVETLLAGLANVLAHLGMTTGEVPPSSPQDHPGWEWLRTPVSGWWDPAVKAGQRVEVGEVLGVVSELVGGPLHKVIAPVAGVPLFVTASPAVVADGLVMGLARAADV